MNDGFDLILRSLTPDSAEPADEAAMLDLIAARVSELIADEPDLLFSYMYRLDIDQDKIEEALIPGTEPVEMQLARLILTRQKQRLATKARYKVDPIDGWEY